MPDDVDLAGRDEPSRGADDHSELLSELDSHDIAVAVDPEETADGRAFEFDAAADPDGTFPQSVASGGPTPEGVILWTRVSPEVFDAGRCLAVQVARDAAMTDVGYAVDKTVDSPEADRSVVAAYRVPAGEVELQDATEEFDR